VRVDDGREKRRGKTSVEEEKKKNREQRSAQLAVLKR